MTVKDDTATDLLNTNDGVSIDCLDDFTHDLTVDDAVAFKRRGPSLLVGFDVVKDADVALNSHRGRLHAIAEEMGWSHLAFLSRGRGLFRTSEVVTFMDALADSTLFDQFDDVLFHGSGRGANGAICFALAAPSARVLAFAPMVGLDGTSVSAGARMDLATQIDTVDRYAPTPANLAAASQIIVVIDPSVPTDMVQADALLGDNVNTVVLRDHGMPHEAPDVMRVLDDVVKDAMKGSLTPQGFYAKMRIARRDNPLYLRRLTARLINKDRKLLEALAVRNIARRTGRKRFARRLVQLENDLIREGISVPALRIAS